MVHDRALVFDFLATNARHTARLQIGGLVHCIMPVNALAIADTHCAYSYRDGRL